MSLLTKGFGGDASNLLVQGFFTLLEMIEKAITWAIGKIKRRKWPPKKEFFEMEIPVVGSVFFVSKFPIWAFGTPISRILSTFNVRGSIISKVEVGIRAIGSIFTPFKLSITSLGTLIKPILLETRCIGALRVKLSNIFVVRGQKTYNRLIALLTVLDEDEISN